MKEKKEMRFTRRDLPLAGALTLGTASLMLSSASLAQSISDETSIAHAVEALRKAMLDADRGQLHDLAADQLSYGHSSGKVETRAQFVETIASKKTIFRSITLSEPTVTIAGNNAIVRHLFSAEVESDGSLSSVKLGVLQVWQNHNGRWKLLARQGYKI